MDPPDPGARRPVRAFQYGHRGPGGKGGRSFRPRPKSAPQQICTSCAAGVEGAGIRYEATSLPPCARHTSPSPHSSPHFVPTQAPGSTSEAPVTGAPVCPPRHFPSSPSPSRTPQAPAMESLAEVRGRRRATNSRAAKFGAESPRNAAPATDGGPDRPARTLAGKPRSPAAAGPPRAVPVREGGERRQVGLDKPPLREQGRPCRLELRGEQPGWRAGGRAGGQLQPRLAGAGAFCGAKKRLSACSEARSPQELHSPPLH